MSLDQQIELPPDKTREVLSRRGTDVLSPAKADEPCAIPISYGYDGESGRFYLRFVSVPESEKRQLPMSSLWARFVTHESSDGSYRGTIAEGTPECVDPDEPTVERVVRYGRARRLLSEI